MRKIPAQILQPTFTAIPCAIKFTRPADAPSWTGATITAKSQLSSGTGSSVPGDISGQADAEVTVTFPAASRTQGDWAIDLTIALSGGATETIRYEQRVEQSIP